MDWYDNDPFNSMVREFFGESQVRRGKRQPNFIEGEEEEKVIDFIETKENVFLIFELPGYDEKDISLTINNRRIEIQAQKKSIDNVQEYLVQKLHAGISLKKNLPLGINTKKYHHTYTHGILEVRFQKSND